MIKLSKLQTVNRPFIFKARWKVIWKQCLSCVTLGFLPVIPIYFVSVLWIFVLILLLLLFAFPICVRSKIKLLPYCFAIIIFLESSVSRLLYSGNFEYNYFSSIAKYCSFGAPIFNAIIIVLIYLQLLILIKRFNSLSYSKLDCYIRLFLSKLHLISETTNRRVVDGMNHDIYDSLNTNRLSDGYIDIYSIPSINTVSKASISSILPFIEFILVFFLINLFLVIYTPAYEALFSGQINKSFEFLYGARLAMLMLHLIFLLNAILFNTQDLNNNVKPLNPIA